MLTKLVGVTDPSHGNSQLFEPTATVETSWWASSLFLECTEDESPQQELEESPQSKSWNLDIKYKFNRPGEAGAVLQTALSLINKLIKWVSQSSFVKISSKHHTSQTVRAKDLKFNIPYV